MTYVDVYKNVYKQNKLATDFTVKTPPYYTNGIRGKVLDFLVRLFGGSTEPMGTRKQEPTLPTPDPSAILAAMQAQQQHNAFVQQHLRDVMLHQQ